MAKQLCDPYRRGEIQAFVFYALPGVAIAKGDLLIKDATNPHYVKPASEEVVANRAVAAAAFAGVATNAVAADAVNKRLVVATDGYYAYTLDAAASVVAGDYVTFDDDTTDLLAQGVKVTATIAEAIGVVAETTGHPDHVHTNKSTPIASASLDETKDEAVIRILPKAVTVDLLI
jgi:hypothetical protein